MVCDQADSPSWWKLLPGQVSRQLPLTSSVFCLPSYLIVFLWRQTIKQENKEPFASIMQIVSMKQRQHDQELDSGMVEIMS